MSACEVRSEQENAESQAAMPKITAVTDIASTRWIKLQTLDYKDQMGKMRKWDMATRTTKRPEASADAVVILALLKEKSIEEKETLVVEQFRPPVCRTTVELPAGLIDVNETPEEAALRELKEETGYTGQVACVSPEVCMSPDICDETVRIVVVNVDLDEAANKHPKQQLEEGEYCVVRRIPLSKLRQEIDKSKGMPIEGIYLLAQGVELGASLSSNVMTILSSRSGHC